MSNPFATKFIRAGAVPYHFLGRESFATLRCRLVEHNWRGQIIGPHGSGKSTLLSSLTPKWEHWGKTPYQICLRDGERSLPAGLWKRVRQGPTDMLVVDGYEQLNLMNRAMLLWRCRLLQCGLLATSHQQSRWLPVVFRTETTEKLANELTMRLLANPHAIELTDGTEPAFIKTLFNSYSKHEGNLREVFLSLYDEVANQCACDNESSLPTGLKRSAQVAPRAQPKA